MKIIDLSTLLTIIGILVAFTNLAVQVIKKITWDKIPTQLLAFIVAQICSVLGLFVYAAIIHLVVLWYYVIGSVVLGFLVSYAAMFGFDKLKEILQDITGLKK